MSSSRIEIPYLCVFSSNTGKYRLEKLFTQLNALERVEAIEINKDDPFSFPAFLWTDSVYEKTQVKKNGYLNDYGLPDNIKKLILMSFFVDFILARKLAIISHDIQITVTRAWNDHHFKILIAYNFPWNVSWHEQSLYKRRLKQFSSI